MEANWKFKETFKEFKQQLNHDTNSYKKDFQKHLEKKGKVDLISKSLLSLSVEDENSCMTTLRKVLLFFYFVWN